MIINLPKLGPVQFEDGLSKEAFKQQVDSLAKKYGFEVDKGPSGPSAAFRSAISNLKGDIGLLGAKMGIEGAEDYASQKYEQAENQFTPSKFSEHPLDYLGELAAGSAPYMAAPLVAGVAGTIAAPLVGIGAGLGAAGLATAASATQFTGSNLARQMQEGATLEDADLGRAIAGALPMALLDTAALRMMPGIGRLFGNAGVKVTEQQLANIAKNGIVAQTTAAVKNYGPAVLKTATYEGLTESGQQFIERLQANLDTMSPAAQAEYLESFAGGALLGGALSVPGRFIERSSARSKLQAPQEQAAVPPQEKTLALPAPPATLALPAPPIAPTPAPETYAEITQTIERLKRGPKSPEVTAQIQALQAQRTELEQASIERARPGAPTPLTEQITSQAPIQGEFRETVDLPTQEQVAPEAIAPEVEKPMPAVLTPELLSATGLSRQSGYFKRLVNLDLMTLPGLDALVQANEEIKANSRIAPETKDAFNTILTQAFNLYAQQGEMFGPRGGVAPGAAEPAPPALSNAQKIITEVVKDKDLNDPATVQDIVAKLTAYGEKASGANATEIESFLTDLEASVPKTTEVIDAEPTRADIGTVEPSISEPVIESGVPTEAVTAPDVRGVDVSEGPAGLPSGREELQQDTLTGEQIVPEAPEAIQAEEEGSQVPTAPAAGVAENKIPLRDAINRLVQESSLKQADAVEYVNQVSDNFGDVESSELEQKIKNNPKSKYSQAPAGTKGISVDKVKKIVAQIKASWKNAPEIVEVQSISDLPPALYAQILRDKVNPRGAYDPDSKIVYLIADNLRSGTDVAITLAHEALGHFGLQTILGAKFTETMLNIYKGNAGVRARADVMIAEGMDKATAVEEVLAEYAQEVYDETATGNNYKINTLQKIVNMIRQFFANMGYPLKGISDSEIRGLIAQARGYVAQGEGRVGSGRVAASGIKFRPGTSAFKAWFGNSKIVDAEGKPRVMYHGTAQDISTFRAKQAGAIFVTDNPRVAGAFANLSEEWMARHADEVFSPEQLAQLKKESSKTAKREGTNAEDEFILLAIKNLPSNANILPVYVRAEKPFDYENPAHVQELEKQISLSTKDYVNVIGGSWKAIESEYIQKAIKAAGFDGFYVKEGGVKNLAVYEPTQIKSAIGNTGTYDINNPDIRYSARAQVNNVGQTLNGLPPFADNIKESVLNTWSKVPDALRKASIGMFSLPQIEQMFKTALPSISKLNSLLAKHGFEIANGREHIARNITKWDAIAKEHAAVLPKFFDIANETTRLQIDPLDKQFANNPLTKRFESLPPELQGIYKELRKEYDAYSEQLIQMIEKNLTGDAAKKVRAQFESKRLKVYLPFRRFGDYWLTYTDKAGERVVESFNSPRERDMGAQKATTAGGTDFKNHAKLSQVSYKSQPPTGFMGDVLSAMAKNKASDATMNDVYQAYLSYFPAESLRQQFRKREDGGVKGFSQDILQAYADVAPKMSRQLNNLKFAPEVDNAFNSIKQEATNNPTISVRDAVADIELRIENARSPDMNALTNAASYGSYMMYIAGNVSSALINLTQLPMVVYPMLGGKYGFDKAASAMKAATATYWQGGRDTNTAFMPDHTFGVKATGDLKALYETALANGVLTRSTGYEINEARKSKTEDFTGTKAKVEHGLSWIFQNSERANREITLIAAFNMAKASGKNTDAAIQEALNLTIDAHGVAMTSMGPRLFQQGLGKVIFTFKRFAQTQIYLQGRLFKEAFSGADAETKSIARRQLLGIAGMTYLFAGVQGLPLYGGVSLLASMLLGDDDEPFDMDAEVRAAIGDLGYKGPLNQLVNLDIASRTGFNGMLWREDPKRLAEVGPVTYTIEKIAGPAYGVLKGFERAGGLFADGELERGLEAASPSFLRNSMKAMRFATEGALTKDGTPIVDNVNAYNSLMQVFGFNPADVAEAGARAGAMKTAESKINARRISLLDQLDGARMSGDIDGENDVRDQMATFSEKNPELRITNETIASSFAKRRANERDSVDGVTLGKKNREYVMDVYGQ